MNRDMGVFLCRVVGNKWLVTRVELASHLSSAHHPLSPRERVRVRGNVACGVLRILLMRNLDNYTIMDLFLFLISKDS
jgi:hypothetical protein